MDSFAEVYLKIAPISLAKFLDFSSETFSSPNKSLLLAAIPIIVYIKYIKYIK